MESVAIIGAGKVGTTLAVALKKAGYSIAGISSRRHDSARAAARYAETEAFSSHIELTTRASIIFITTPDRAIKKVCAGIAGAGGFKKGQVVLHTSGAHSSDILAPAKEKGAFVLSFHPLQTIPNVESGLENLPGSYFTIEGDERAFPVAEKMVKALGGKLLSIPTEMKPLYHAAACVVCNYFVGLIDLGLQMMSALGVSRDEALNALMPLIEGTLNNIKRVGVPQALTGPIERGDADTIKAHLELMDKVMPEFTPLYKHLGAYTTGVAAAKGTLTEEKRTHLSKLLGGNC